MELGDATAVCNQPKHPYTESLLAAAPVANPAEQAHRRQTRATTKAQHLQNATDATTSTVDACPFAARCRYAIELCTASRPALELTDDGRLVSCHRWREISLQHSQPTQPEVAHTD
jgi:oligopeptide transport system ATP-binding protein